MPNNSTQSAQPVLIAGGGPTGLTAALELRRFGIPVRIIDEKEGPSDTSRAIGIQARTLEELELRGLAGDLVRIGHHANGGDIYGEGKLLVHVDFTKIPSSYNYLLFLSQNETERILREALEAEGAAIEWGVKMIAFGQDSSGITATLEHSDGSMEEVRPSYVIDAEGAHSIIRSTLGLQFTGKTLDETFILGDVHVSGDLPNTSFHIFSSQLGFLGLFPMGGSHFRLVAGNPNAGKTTGTSSVDPPVADPVAARGPNTDAITTSSANANASNINHSTANQAGTPPDANRIDDPARELTAGSHPTTPLEDQQSISNLEDAPVTLEDQQAAPTLEELQAVYDQRSHIPARLHQLTWSSYFHINSRMVKTLRVGRIFLAGDAAHIHSPAGAQGMNTGIQDAINLGWKLALVMQGIAPEELLGTYEQDRITVMRSVLLGTEGMTNITGGQSILRTFFIHLAPLLGNAEFVQKNATARISQIALTYRTSPLSEDHFGDGSLVAGDRIPDLEIRASSSGAQSSPATQSSQPAPSSAAPSSPLAAQSTSAKRSTSSAQSVSTAPSSATAQAGSQKIFSLLNPSRFTLLLANFPDSAASQTTDSNSVAPDPAPPDSAASVSAGSNSAPSDSDADPDAIRAKLFKSSAHASGSAASSSPAPDPAAIRAKVLKSYAPWQDLIDTFEISAPTGDAGKSFTECFGVKPSITFVRPDAYIGFRGGQSSADELPKYLSKWLSPAAQKQAAA
jgi:3-(3-hydroxy-phenyl)propionate hydroxylase